MRLVANKTANSINLSISTSCFKLKFLIEKSDVLDFSKFVSSGSLGTCGEDHIKNFTMTNKINISNKTRQDFTHNFKKWSAEMIFRNLVFFFYSKSKPSVIQYQVVSSGTLL